MLQRLLGLPTPTYRHHFLLLEAAGDKLAKLHGSIPFSQVSARYTGPALCGWLAYAAQLRPEPAPCTPTELVESFDWAKVPRTDRVVRFDPDRGLYIV
jgi:glutamyl/glutaminyl-tRNA synthetase